MCGRYSLAVDTRQLAMHFDVDVTATEWVPHFLIAPKTTVPIVRERQNQRGLSQAIWGLRPSWAKDDGPRPINARIETVATKNMFTSSFASMRCLVPMTGYYEWVKEPRVDKKPIKQPYAIALPDQALLAAAGLFAAYRQRVTDPWQVTCTIITRQAKDASGQVHDRMPAFISPEHWDWWLDPTRPGQAQDIDQLMQTSDQLATQLTTWKVSRRINYVSGLDATDPTLIDPIT